MNVKVPQPQRHHLLWALPTSERERLIRWSDIVHLSRGETVHEPGEPVEHIYFPLSAVFSLFGITFQGDTVELCHVGTEGIVGIFSMTVSQRVYQHEMLRTDVRIPGTALRVARDPLLEQFSEGSPLYACIGGYLDMLLGNLITGATCNRHHSLEQRSARWLLSIQDRIQQPDIDITQEHLADILGVRRQSIDIVLGALEKDGVIMCARGRISVIDRQSLEGRVCECYMIGRRRLDTFIGGLAPT